MNSPIIQKSSNANSAQDIEQEQNALRSDIYLLLSSLYRDAPTTETLAFLSELDVDDESSEMQQAWSSLKLAAKNAEASVVTDEFQELFIGIGRGEVVPFASWHITGSLMEKPLATLRQDLKIIGLERDQQVKEPEDHIAALFEVMSFIAGAHDELQQAFYNKHIANWFESLTKQVIEAPSSDFYGSVAGLTQAFLTREKVKFSENSTRADFGKAIEIKNLIDTVDE